MGVALGVWVAVAVGGGGVGVGPVGVAVIVAGVEVRVGVGLGVGVAAGGLPAPMTISTRLKPGCGPAVGHAPGTKFPNWSNEPEHPLSPPPQLLISSVIATNSTTGATTIHLKRLDIE